MNNDLNKNENKDLDELMKIATEKIEEKDEEQEVEKKSPKKIILWTSISMVAFIGLLSVGGMMLGDQEFENKSKTPEWVAEEKGEDEINHNVFEFARPVEIYPWAQEPYNIDTFWANEKNEKDILALSLTDYRNFYSNVAWIKSGIAPEDKNENLAGPFTNDTMKQYNDNGSINKDFSYALSEDYQKAYALSMERLLNPVFGGWAVAQSSEKFGRDIAGSTEFRPLEDLFDKTWWENNITKTNRFDNLPLMAEWKSGSWEKYNINKDVPSTNGVFYGKLAESEGHIINVQNLGSDSMGQPILKVSSPVKFYAFNEKGGIVTVDGTLDLTFKSNELDIDVKKRVVISDAKLTINQ